MSRPGLIYRFFRRQGLVRVEATVEVEGNAWGDTRSAITASIEQGPLKSRSTAHSPGVPCAEGTGLCFVEGLLTEVKPPLGGILGHTRGV